MPIRRGNPFEEVQEMLERMGQGMDDLPAGTPSVAVDVEDRGGEFVVTADLPGFGKDDVEVTIADDRLRIEAERETDEEEHDGEYVRRERRRSSASRSVRLPEAVDEEGITASLSDGVLTVALPKRGGDGGRQIEIE